MFARFGATAVSSRARAAVAALAFFAHSGLLFPRVSTACPPSALTASDAAWFDDYGWSVATSGDLVVIGAPFHDQPLLDEGAAYVFRRSAGSWIEEAILLADDARSEDELGHRVAIDGDVALVSTIQADGGGNGTGAVYVYSWDGSMWNQLQELFPSKGDFGDGFGFGVAVLGNIAVIGAFWDDDVAFNAGAAYVFQYDGSSWIQQQKLVASDGEAQDWFGVSVAIAPDLILVGASRGAGLSPDSGCAYVFRWMGSQWVEEQKLVADDLGGPADDEIGWSVGLSTIAGGTALVSHHRDNDARPGNGSAYIFSYNGSEWLQTQELFPVSRPLGFNQQFGRSVSMDGDRLVIGAPFASVTGNSDGAAYVFRYDDDSAQWVFQEQLLPDAIPSTSFFGYSVAISDGTVVCGAYGELSQSGRAYVFNVAPPGSADLDCDGMVGPADLAELLAQWGACDVVEDCPADLAPTSGGGDGIVGPADLAELLANWG